MRYKLHVLAVAVALALPSAALAAGTHRYVGTVGDTMCGAHHKMAGNPAACTRKCVQMGSQFALVAGHHLYKLDASGANADELNQLAGERAVVKGTLRNGTITVTSVQAAK